MFLTIFFVAKMMPSHLECDRCKKNTFYQLYYLKYTKIRSHQNGGVCPR